MFWTDEIIVAGTAVKAKGPKNIQVNEVNIHTHGQKTVYESTMPIKEIKGIMYIGSKTIDVMIK